MCSLCATCHPKNMRAFWRMLKLIGSTGCYGLGTGVSLNFKNSRPERWDFLLTLDGKKLYIESAASTYPKVWGE